MAHWAYRFPGVAQLVRSRFLWVGLALVAAGVAGGIAVGFLTFAGIRNAAETPAESSPLQPSASASETVETPAAPQPAPTVTFTVTPVPSAGPSASDEDLAIGKEMLDALDVILPRDYRPDVDSEDCWRRHIAHSREQIVLSQPACGIRRSDSDGWLYWWGFGFNVDPDTHELANGSLLVHTGHQLRVLTFVDRKPGVVDLITPEGVVVRLRPIGG